MPAPAITVSAFLASLPPASAKELRRVRTVIRQHLPAGFEEAVRGEMIVYEVPLRRYPDTYNGHPLWLAALGASLSLHLMAVYASPAHMRRLQEGFRAAGKKLEIGKACIHFHSADDLALEVIGDIIASMPLGDWVAIAKAARQR